jgi:hypothetical protein
MWRNYFGYGPSNAVNVKGVTTKYRQMSLKKHPNKGGSAANFQQLKNMYDAAVANLSSPRPAPRPANSRPLALTAKPKRDFRLKRRTWRVAGKQQPRPKMHALERMVLGDIMLLRRRKQAAAQRPGGRGNVNGNGIPNAVNRTPARRVNADRYMAFMASRPPPPPPPRRPSAARPIRPRVNPRNYANYNVFSRSAPRRKM